MAKLTKLRMMMMVEMCAILTLFNTKLAEIVRLIFIHVQKQSLAYQSKCERRNCMHNVCAHEAYSNKCTQWGKLFADKDDLLIWC